jgi:hypothetical protein
MKQFSIAQYVALALEVFRGFLFFVECYQIPAWPREF